MTKIISLGGSIIVPNEIDVGFLKKFKDMINDFVSSGEKVVIVTGGGSTARKYQKALAEVIGQDQEAMDWVGISATHINAFLLKSIFNDVAETEIIEDPTQEIKFNKKVLLAAGWKPGWSTDMDAVLLAENLKADTVINVSNIDFVYDKDPNKFDDAKKIEKTSWDGLLEIIGTEWKPGLNAPFDPIAAKKAKELGIKAFIVGKNIENLSNVLKDKEFIGTKIE
jgi:uridylate kinase